MDQQLDGDGNPCHSMNWISGLPVIPASFRIWLFFPPWLMRKRIWVHWSMSRYTSFPSLKDLFFPVLEAWTALLNRPRVAIFLRTFQPPFESLESA